MAPYKVDKVIFFRDKYHPMLACPYYAYFICPFQGSAVLLRSLTIY